MGENITDFDITLLSSTCSANTTNALLTLDDIAAVKGSKAVMPSMCDGTFTTYFADTAFVMHTL